MAKFLGIRWFGIIGAYGFIVVLIAQAGFVRALAQGEGASSEQSPFEAYKAHYVSIVEAENPKIALTVLREDVAGNPDLLRVCHPLVHAIGHAAYAKYGDFGAAMQYQDEICNSGYLHGIIETHFEESEDLFSALESVCEPYPKETYLSWQCYHGVGHGVMFYTKNDLPRSLELCDSYRKKFARNSCVNGVFMENFNTNQKMHPSAYLKETDYFYPCYEQKLRHRIDCYIYAPTYFLSFNENDYVGALRWCEDANKYYRPVCAQGVGGQAIKENISEPKKIETVCEGNKSSQVEPCIVGMSLLFLYHHGRIDPALAMCDELERSNRRTCRDAIRNSARLFRTS